MLDASASKRTIAPPTLYHFDANRLFQHNAYHSPGSQGVLNPFPPHIQPHHGHGLQQASNSSSQQLNAAIAAMSQPPHGSNCVVPQLPHNLSSSSQSLAAALFANSPLINDNLKLAAAAAAVVQSRGKKTHRVEPVPQSGFKGVSWNSRMKAWLAFYVTENGERKSKTFSTRKLGMEEARLQAITFCKQKQVQRREARKRDSHNQHCSTVAAHGNSIGNGLNRLSSDESILESPNTVSDQQPHVALRCGYPTTPGMGNSNLNMGGLVSPPTNSEYTSGDSGSAGNSSVQSPPNNSEIVYIPIVPIAVEMIEKSGLLQPLELNVLPPCQHCNKQPYPFLMIVSEGQEQIYSGSSIMNLASQQQQHHHPSPTTSQSASNAKYSEITLDHQLQQQSQQASGQPQQNSRAPQQVGHRPNGGNASQSRNVSPLQCPSSNQVNLTNDEPLLNGPHMSPTLDNEYDDHMNSENDSLGYMSMNGSMDVSQTLYQMSSKQDGYLSKSENSSSPFDHTTAKNDYYAMNSDMSSSKAQGCHLLTHSQSSSNHDLLTSDSGMNHKRTIMSPSSNYGQQISPPAQKPSNGGGSRYSQNPDHGRHSMYPSTMMPSSYSLMSQLPPLPTEAKSQQPSPSTQPTMVKSTPLTSSDIQSPNRQMKYAHQTPNHIWATSYGGQPTSSPHMNVMNIQNRDNALPEAFDLSSTNSHTANSAASSFESMRYHTESSTMQLHGHSEPWGLNNIITSIFSTNDSPAVTSATAAADSR